MCVSLRNSLLFSKKRRFLCISPTEHGIWVRSMMALWKLVLFLQNRSQSIEFAEFYNQTTKTWMFRWEIIFYSRRNVDFRAFRQRITIFWVQSIITLKTRVIPSKQVSFDIVPWTLLTDHKNMSVSLRNNLLFSKKRRFSCISRKEHDIWVRSMMTLWKLVLFLQNWYQSIAFIFLYKQTTKTWVFRWEITFYSRRNVDFRAFLQRNTIFGYDRWRLFENKCYSTRTSLNR